MLRLALEAYFFFLARAGNEIAETCTRAHEVRRLKRAGVAFFRGENQLERRRWSTTDRVEVRFRGSKRDQLRKGAISSRAKNGPPRPVGGGGGAVDLTIELMSCYLFLPPSAPPSGVWLW